MKKVLAILLSVLLLCTALPLGALSVSAATSGTTGSCTWTLNGTVLTISGNGAMKDYTETRQESDTLISTTLYPTPWGKDITSVTIENGVTAIGGGAFYGCSKLTSVTIGNNVTSIGQYAFGSCTSLTTISLPNSVITIERYAFDSCRSLKRVDIPDSVTTIHSRAFEYCRSLTAISVDENNPNYSSVDGVLFDKDQTTLINFPGCSGKTEYTIPNSVTTIGEYAFYSCDSLTSVTIGNGVTTIGDSAFVGCYNLTIVYYSGTEEDRANIEIGYWNEELLNATWHYGYDGHVYDDCWDGDCNKCGEVRDVPDHIFDIWTMEPTCGVEGGTFYTCIICGYGYEEWVPATGDHTYDNNCDSECNVCFAWRQAEHQYDNDCDPECNVCGAVRDVPDHVYDGDCDPECNVCFAWRQAEHQYDNDCDPDCNVCGEVRWVPEHTYDVWTEEPTCGVEGGTFYTCTVCGYNYVEWVPATGDHVYDDEYDADCNACGDVREVPEKPIIYGDANGDGAINARDVALLQQYIVGWDVTPDEAAADANGDGAINARDVALLQQYIVGWDVTLG